MISKIPTTSSGRASTSYKRQSVADTGNSTDSKTDSSLDGEHPNSLLAAVNTVSNYVQSISREVHLYVDDSTGLQRVTVVDSHTGQTIRHIPAAELKAISRHISAKSADPIKGLLVKSEA